MPLSGVGISGTRLINNPGLVLTSFVRGCLITCESYPDHLPLRDLTSYLGSNHDYALLLELQKASSQPNNLERSRLRKDIKLNDPCLGQDGGLHLPRIARYLQARRARYEVCKDYGV